MFYNSMVYTTLYIQMLYRKINTEKKIALTTVCADGGANHFYEMMKARGREDVDVCVYPFIPRFISMLYTIYKWRILVKYSFLYSTTQ